MFCNAGTQERKCMQKFFKHISNSLLCQKEKILHLNYSTIIQNSDILVHFLLHGPVTVILSAVGRIIIAYSPLLKISSRILVHY